MKSNKETVLDFMKLHFSNGETKGISTQYLTERLGMQRTNLSSILNTLVKEGKVSKKNGRPVLYFLSEDEEAGKDCFNNMIGFDGSLNHAVQLAKATVLYPEMSLNALIIGESGTGKSFLAKLMYQYAVDEKVIHEGTSYLVFNSKRYIENGTKAIEDLFGTNGKAGLINSNINGVLLIDHAEYLDVGTRSILCNRLDENNITKDGKTKTKTLVIISCNSKNRSICDDYASKIPISIELPTLQERPLKERMNLLNSFLILESARLKRSIRINAEVLRCLLLYDCEFNLSQLKMDIKYACANAFVREQAKKEDEINIYIGDFKHKVRKGFLHYREFRNEIEEIIPSDYNYLFNESTMEMNAIDRKKLNNKTIYDAMEKRIAELSERGIEDDNIKTIMNVEIEKEFTWYRKELAKEVINKDQLSKLVDIEIISIVETFLDEAEKKLNIEFPTSVFYGLCLHIHAVIYKKENTNKISAKRISEIVEKYKLEYALSSEFVSLIEKKYNISLSIDEITLITMFISYKDPIIEHSKKPVILMAFYGDGVASSITKAIKGLTYIDNVFSYEIPFEQKREVIFEELKEKIKSVDRGAGVIAIYDMNFVGAMLEIIELELNIKIRQMPSPITSIGLELSRKAAIEENLDTVVRNVTDDMNIYKSLAKKVIVTLCTTGVGGAEELKKYIETYGDIGHTEIVALSMNDKKLLKDQLSEIMQTSVVHCIIGTFDPKLYSIPFVSISDVLAANKAELPSILQLKQVKKSKFDFDEIYAYLEEQLEAVDINKLKQLLPVAIKEINEQIVPMSLDTEIGLFIHISCCINRLLKKEKVQENIRKNEIIEQYGKQYRKLIKILKPIEKKFDIIITEDSIANMLIIINKI